MNKSLTEIIGDPLIFLKDLFSMLSDIELDVEKYELDHICYRVESLDEYKQKKDELNDLGELLVESMVNGRLISTFKLINPIEFEKRKIYLIELPAPKKGHAYASGLEHVEFVTKEPLQKIIEKYPNTLLKHLGYTKK